MCLLETFLLTQHIACCDIYTRITFSLFFFSVHALVFCIISLWILFTWLDFGDMAYNTSQSINQSIYQWMFFFFQYKLDGGSNIQNVLTYPVLKVNKLSLQARSYKPIINRLPLIALFGLCCWPFRLTFFATDVSFRSDKYRNVKKNVYKCDLKSWEYKLPNASGLIKSVAKKKIFFYLARA